MEFFDIVDQLGNPTGEKVERSVAHEEGIRHRTAHVWITREKDGVGQVLLQKRAMNKDSFPGCYDTSSAGHITAGQEPEESARRELEEELGIVAQEGDLKFVSCFDILYQEEFHGKMFKDNEIAFLYVYDKPVDLEKLTLQEEEVEGVKWFDLSHVVEAMENDDEQFCVPPKGLAIIEKWMQESR